MKVEEVNGIHQVDHDTATLARQASFGGDFAELSYQAARTAHWDKVARWMDSHRGLGGAYQRRLAEIYGFFVPTGSRVLEIGCARGDLLAALRPSYGLGIDFSSEM